MKLLVTGGAGFIGSNFIHYWLKKYPADQIVNLDILTYAGNLDNLKDIESNPNYKFVKGDITDYELVDSLVKGLDLIVHLKIAPILSAPTWRERAFYWKRREITTESDSITFPPMRSSVRSARMIRNLTKRRLMIRARLTVPPKRRPTIWSALISILINYQSLFPIVPITMVPISIRKN
jgi:hypothetical protein